MSSLNLEMLLRNIIKASVRKGSMHNVEKWSTILQKSCGVNIRISTLSMEVLRSLVTIRLQIL